MHRAPGPFGQAEGGDPAQGPRVCGWSPQGAGLSHMGGALCEGRGLLGGGGAGTAAPSAVAVARRGGPRRLVLWQGRRLLGFVPCLRGKSFFSHASRRSLS